MGDYFDSFDCQVQCEEVYCVDPCAMALGEEEEVSDEEPEDDPEEVKAFEEELKKQA